MSGKRSCRDFLIARSTAFCDTPSRSSTRISMPSRRPGRVTSTCQSCAMPLTLSSTLSNIHGLMLPRPQLTISSHRPTILEIRRSMCRSQSQAPSMKRATSEVR